MDDLVAFVRARLDDRQAVAQGAERYPPNGSTSWTPAALQTTWDARVDDHVALHNPAWALREIRGSRKILDVITSWRHTSCQDGYYSCSQATEANGFPLDEACSDEDRVGKPCDCGLEARQLAILRPLALPYADHPDYRAEWAA